MTTVSVVTLNIGLKTSANHFDHSTRNEELFVRDVELNVLTHWLKPMLNVMGGINTRLARSSTERTLIVRYATERPIKFIRYDIEAVANALHQDCIAASVTSSDGRQFGELYGTYCADWGTFDPEYFINYEV